MKAEKIRNIKKSDGSTCKMTYNDVCSELGFNASVRFVEITSAGTISFSCGKPQEIKSLLNSVRSNGYIPSTRLVNAAR